MGAGNLLPVTNSYPSRPRRSCASWKSGGVTGGMTDPLHLFCGVNTLVVHLSPFLFNTSKSIKAIFFLSDDFMAQDSFPSTWFVSWHNNPDRIRTCDLSLRKASLYPTELPDRLLILHHPRPDFHKATQTSPFSRRRQNGQDLKNTQGGRRSNIILLLYAFPFRSTGHSLDTWCRGFTLLLYV